MTANFRPQDRCSFQTYRTSGQQIPRNLVSLDELTEGMGIKMIIASVMKSDIANE